MILRAACKLHFIRSPAIGHLYKLAFGVHYIMVSSAVRKLEEAERKYCNVKTDSILVTRYFCGLDQVILEVLSWCCYPENQGVQ